MLWQKDCPCPISLPVNVTFFFYKVIYILYKKNTFFFLPHYTPLLTYSLVHIFPFLSHRGEWRIVSFFKLYFTLFLYLFKDFFASYSQKNLISLNPTPSHKGWLKYPYRLTGMAAVLCNERVSTPGCQKLICSFHNFPWCSIMKVMRLRLFCITTLANKSNCQILWESMCASMDNIFYFLNNEHAFLECKS